MNYTEMNMLRQEDPQLVATELQQYIDAENIAENMEESQLDEIGRLVIEEFLIDCESSQEWLDNNKKYVDLAKQVAKDKTSPWPNASNVKLPLLADAAIKFQARAYGELIKDNQVVKAKIPGQDDDASKMERGVRVSEYMSYQLLEEIEEWETDTDQLLLMLSVSGHIYRKTYYDPSYGRIRSYILTPKELHVNNTASSLHTARRATEEYNLHSSDLKGMQNAGCYREIDLTVDHVEGEPEQDDYYKILEQHRYLDLDEDGIEEPYMVTVHRDSGKVLCIKARYDQNSIVYNKTQTKIVRINPIHNYQDYKFFPSFDGSYLGLGLGALLYPLNECANTLFNQLQDAGTLSNLQSGFLSRSVKIRGGINQFKPGEWKKTDSNAGDLRNGILPLPVREPSSTLFSLLGLVLELTKDVASIKDVLSGDSPGANIPATTVAMLVEQGLKTYSAIYKRIYRSLKGEFKTLYKMNYQYLDEEEYFLVLDDTQVAYREDFNYQDCNLVPVADPSLSSDVQRLAQAQALVGALEFPGVQPYPIVRQYLEAVKARDIDQILPKPEDGPSPDMQAQMEMMQAQIEAQQQEMALKQREIEIKEAELQLKSQVEGEKAKIKEMELSLKAEELGYKGEKYLADSIKSIADAEAKEEGTQIQAYKAVLDENQRELENDERRVSRMGESSSDQSG